MLWTHSPGCIVVEGVCGLVVYLCVADGFISRLESEKTRLIQHIDDGTGICEAAFFANVVVSDVQGFVRDPPASRIITHTHTDTHHLSDSCM